MDEQKQTQLEIDLSHEVAQGTYANLTIIAHSTSEFIIDFIRLMPGVTKPEVKSRIILTPENAKRLMLALQDNILNRITVRYALLRKTSNRQDFLSIWNRKDRLE